MNFRKQLKKLRTKCEKSPKIKNPSKVGAFEGLKSIYIRNKLIFKHYKSMNNNLNKQEKREQLKAVSQAIKNLVNEGVYTSVNDGLISMYKNHKEIDFKTFEQWKNAGYSIKQGEKAVYIWGKQLKKTITEDGEEKEIKFFPLVALFSDLQVYKPENNK